MSSPPNIIVFQADQLTALALQLYGGFCETPFLNSLAEKSTLFENA
jgi:arylsulfatase A-like enzyme